MERIEPQEHQKTIKVGEIECPAIEINGEYFPVIIPDKITDKKD